MNTKTFLENDLCIFAYLTIKGYRLLDVVSKDGRRFAFLFADPEGDANKAVMGYMAGECASARDLFASERNLKSLLHARKNPRTGYESGYENSYENRRGNGHRQGSRIG